MHNSSLSPLFPYTTLFRSLRLGAGAGPRRADPAVDRRGDARAHRGRLRDQGASDAARRTGAGGTSFEAMTSTRGTRTWPRLVITVTTWSRSEEHTPELQSRGHLVCRLLLGEH